MKLKDKLYLSFGILVLLISTIAALNFLIANSLKKDLNKLSTDQIGNTEILLDISLELSELGKTVFEIVNVTDIDTSHYLSTIRRNSQNIHNSVDMLPLQGSVKNVELLPKMHAKIDSIFAPLIHYISNHNALNQAEKQKQLVEFKSNYDRFRDFIHRHQRQYTDTISTKMNALKKSSSRMTSISTALILAIFVFIAIITFQLTRSILTPINSLTGFVKNLERGLFPEKEISPRKDEFGQLEGAFYQLSVSLKDTLEELSDEIKHRTESETLFRSLFDQSQIDMVLVDQSGVIQLANQSIQDLFGVEEKDFYGHKLWNKKFWSSNPEMIPVLKMKLEEAFAGEPLSFPQQQLQVGDEVHYANMAMYPIRNKDNEVQYVMVTAIDITDNVIAQNELNKSNERFEAIFNQTFQFIGLLDIEGTVVKANATALDFVGIVEDDVVGKPFWLSAWFDHDPIQQQKLKDAIEKALKGDLQRFETTHFSKDGELIHVDFSLTPYKDEKGNIIFLIPEGRDITALKNAEKAVLESQEKYRTIYEQIQDVFFEINTEDVITETSPSVEKIFGYAPNELIGFDVNKLYYKKSYRENLDTELYANHYVVDFEVEFVHKDGYPVPCSVSANLIFENEEFAGIRGIVREITARKNAENRLRLSEDKFEKMFRLSPTMLSLVRISDGKVLDVNDQLLDKAGQKREEVLGKTWDDIELQPSEEDSRKLIEKFEKDGILIDYEVNVLNRAGESLDLLTSMILVNVDDEPCYISFAHDVTPLKTSERELNEKTEKYQTLFNSAGDAIFFMDGDRFIDCNPKTLEIFECEYEDIIGQPPYKFSPEFQKDGMDSTEKALLYISKAFAGQPQFFEWQHQTHAGRVFDAEVTLNMVKIENNTFLQAIVRDITERKEAEFELRQRFEFEKMISELSHQFVNVLPDEIDNLIISVLGKIAKSTKIDFAAFVQYSDDQKYFSIDHIWSGIEISGIEIQTKNVELTPEIYIANEMLKGKVLAMKDISPIPDTKTGYRKILNKLGVNSILSVPVMRKDKVTAFLSLNSIESRDWTEHEISLLEIIGQIFTGALERVKAEVELNKTKNYVSNIIDSMPSILISVDVDGNVTNWNKEASERTGITSEKANEHPLDELLPYMKQNMSIISEAISTREVRKKNRVHSEDTEHTYYSDITVYPLVANGIEGAVVRIDDITEKVRIEEMMIQTEKMMSVGGLAAGFAHEINNPLGIILQSAQNLERRTSPQLKKNIEIADKYNITIEQISDYLRERGIYRYIDSIRSAGKRSSHIISNMLSFSRKSESTKTEVDLRELIDETIELASSDYDLKKKFDFKQIRIVKDVAENLETIFCERTKIQQVLFNLVKNSAYALSSNDPDQKPPQISFTAVKKKKFVKIEVADNGTGMDEETRKRVFEPFYTTKETGDGTGLGLSVSYFIITDNHNGSIEVDSKQGEGTRFTIKLPVRES